MPTYVFKDLPNQAAPATLASAITSSATTIPLTTGVGTLLPSPTGGDLAACRIEQELITYDTRTTDTLTGVTRGVGGTTAVAHTAGRQVRNVAIADFFNNAGGGGVTAHSALTGLTTGDDHTQYQKESEKGAASGYAPLDSGLLVPIANIPTGTSGTTVALGNHTHLSITNGVWTFGYDGSGHLIATAPSGKDFRVVSNAGASIRLLAASGAVLNGAGNAFVQALDNNSAGIGGGPTGVGGMLINTAGRVTIRPEAGEQVVLSSIPNTDPSVTDAVWFDSGVLVKSGSTVPTGGGSVATDTIFDAKGDLPVGTGADTAARVPVGADGTHLEADSSQSASVKWVGLVSASVYHSADQNASSGSGTALSFDSERKDTDAQHFTSSANLTGTVAKTNGSATLTGTGTAFDTELSVGQVISVPGTTTERRVVTAIASATSLTVAVAFTATASGQTATRVNTALVCRSAGTYVAVGNARYAQNGSGERQLHIRLNGTTIVGLAWAGPNSTYFGHLDVTMRPYDLALWDYLELVFYQDSGSTLAVHSAGNWSPEFGFWKVG